MQPGAALECSAGGAGRGATEESHERNRILPATGHRRGHRPRQHRRRGGGVPARRRPPRRGGVRAPADRPAHRGAAGRDGGGGAYARSPTRTRHARRLGAAGHQGAPHGLRGALAGAAVRPLHAGGRAAERHRPRRPRGAVHRRGHRRADHGLLQRRAPGPDRVRLRHVGGARHGGSRRRQRPGIRRSCWTARPSASS